ncbi:MAG: CrcB family protein [Nitrospirota bacterium]|nr:CrcB family protein [Nitrospirota bacterium]
MTPTRAMGLVGGLRPVWKMGALFFLGGVGAFLRYAMAGWVQTRTPALFPAGTLAVNTLGCFLFGLIFGAAEERFLISSETRAVLLIGFVGAFTTFSSLVFEALSMLEDRAYLTAFLYFTLSHALGLGSMLLGLTLFRLF